MADKKFPSGAQSSANKKAEQMKKLSKQEKLFLKYEQIKLFWGNTHRGKDDIKSDYGKVCKKKKNIMTE